MKRLVYLLIAASLMLALVPAAAFAHTEDDPFVTNLIAGGGNEKSAMDVGQVEVWNDADYLYVKYVVDVEGWCLTETHLHVATSPEVIPQKNGNPIPGKFEDSSEYALDPCEQGPDPYMIPLDGWDVGTELYIAAHAVVVDTSSMMMEPAVSEPGVDVYGPMDQYYVLNDTNWTGPNPAVATWVHGSWPSIAGATWISTAYYTEDPVNDSWRWFHDEITLPEKGYYISGSVVLATSDNAEEAYHNETMIGSDGEVQGPFIDNLECGTIVEYPFNPQPGVNTLDFIVRNYYQAGGSATSNPTGLIYKASATYYPEETAWGFGPGFPGKNWATYFTYTVQCPYEPGLLNGGFEDPVVGTSQGWDIYDSGYSDLGWTVEWRANVPDSWGGWTRPDPAHLELHDSGTVVDAYEGNQYAELDTDWDGPGGGLNGEPASVKIYQDLTTCPGQTYELKYAWSPRSGYDSQLEVYWNGTPVGSHNGNTAGWTLETVSVAASDWSTRLEFVEVGPADSFGMFLDAVSIQKE
jgi:hypothetical protein